MYPKHIVLSFIVMACSVQGAAAQGFSDWLSSTFGGRMETGIHFGTSHYIGELSEQLYGNQLFSGGLTGKYHFNRIAARDRTWGLRVDLNYTKIEGDDFNSNSIINQNRGLKFTNDIYEASAVAEFHFWNFRPNRATGLMTPYVFAGVGGIYHNPKADHPDGSGSRVSLIDAMIEVPRVSYEEDDEGISRVTHIRNYQKINAVLPFGAGFKYNFSGPLSIGLEVNYRYVFSDFIDGIGVNEYLDYDKIRDKLPAGLYTQTQWETLAAPSTITGGTNYADLIGDKRGKKGNDFFMTTVLRVTYTFYKWRDPIWK